MFLSTVSIDYFCVCVVGCCGGGGRTVVEPVPKAIEAILDEVFRSAEVEPGVDYLTYQSN